MEAFQNGDVSVPIGEKRIKKYAFSNEIALLWTGKTDTKTLVWIKIFCRSFSLRRKWLLLKTH